MLALIPNLARNGAGALSITAALGAGGSASFGCFGAAPSLFNAGIEWMPDALATQVSDVAIGVGAKHGTEIMRRRPGKPVVDKADGDDDADQ